MFANLIVVVALIAVLACYASASLSEHVQGVKRAFLKREDYASDHDFHNAMLFNNHAQLAHEDMEIRMDEKEASSSAYVYIKAYSSSTCGSSTEFATNLNSPIGNIIIIIIQYYLFISL